MAPLSDWAAANESSLVSCASVALQFCFIEYVELYKTSSLLSTTMKHISCMSCQQRQRATTKNDEKELVRRLVSRSTPLFRMETSRHIRIYYCVLSMCTLKGRVSKAATLAYKPAFGLDRLGCGIWEADATMGHKTLSKQVHKRKRELDVSNMAATV